MEYLHITHGFGPLYDENCDTLILGSFPSPKSREQGFYYGHPQNRFWRVLASVFGEAVPQSIEEKSALCLAHHIALWDSIEECDILGASDSSIKNAVPTDVPALLAKTRISRVFTTGKASYRYYTGLTYPKTGLEAVCLPSTSPANCAVSFEKLTESYRILLKK